MVDRSDILLVQLGEEAAEVIQETSKCVRFGMQEVYEKIGISNIERVGLELNDLMALVEIMQEENLLPQNLFKRDLIEAKKEKVKTLMAYSKSLGRI